LLRVEEADWRGSGWLIPGADFARQGFCLRFIVWQVREDNLRARSAQSLRYAASQRVHAAHHDGRFAC